MKQDRFLMAILAGIGLLVIVALALFLARQGRATYGPEDTPAGVLHNYALALYRGEYQRAYSYLVEAEYKPTYDHFRQAFLSRQLDPGSVSLQINATDVSDNEAVIAITIVHRSSGPFEDAYREPQTATLTMQDGKWKIRFLPYPYFNWDWYQKPVK